MCKYIAPMEIDDIWASVQGNKNQLSQNRFGYTVSKQVSSSDIAPMGIEDLWASVENILACKYIAPIAKINKISYQKHVFLFTRIHHHYPPN